MAADPYTVLSVKKDASQDEIQKAYRRLGKKLHPDLNPGNKQAEERFKEISAAYDLLGDPDKRARFDRGEIDASGMERPRQPYYRDFAEGGAYASDAGFADFAGIDDILSQMFGREGRANQSARPSSSHDVRIEAVAYAPDVSLACCGCVGAEWMSAKRMAREHDRPRPVLLLIAGCDELHHRIRHCIGPRSRAALS